MRNFIGAVFVALAAVPAEGRLEALHHVGEREGHRRGFVGGQVTGLAVGLHESDARGLVHIGIEHFEELLHPLLGELHPARDRSLGRFRGDDFLDPFAAREGEVERRMYRLRLGGKANPKPQKIRKRRSNPEDHAQSPFHGTLLRAGWAYSHTTPVVMGGDRRASYSYKRGEHNVGVLHAPWGWEWSGGHAGTQTGRSGRTAEALAKYLRGVASREKKHAEQQASRRAERAEKDARMRKFDALLKRNPKRRRS